jgi:hypothetical protein
MNCGSLDSFLVSTRCGLSPKGRQIREIAVWLSPTAAAIDRVDQCVSLLAGASSNVEPQRESVRESARHVAFV